MSPTCGAERITAHLMPIVTKQGEVVLSNVANKAPLGRTKREQVCCQLGSSQHSVCQSCRFGTQHVVHHDVMPRPPHCVALQHNAPPSRRTSLHSTKQNMHPFLIEASREQPSHLNALQAIHQCTHRLVLQTQVLEWHW